MNPTGFTTVEVAIDDLQVDRIIYVRSPRTAFNMCTSLLKDAVKSTHSFFEQS